MTNELAKWMLLKSQQVIERDVLGAEDQMSRLAQIGSAWRSIATICNKVEMLSDPWLDPAQAPKPAVKKW